MYSLSATAANKLGRWVFIITIALAMALRLLLGTLNNEANDNHVDVVSYIIDNHALPEKEDCWSCYQPKLYYLVCAVPVQLLHLQGYSARVKAMQLVNVLCSFFLLLIVWGFLKRLSFTGYLMRELLFALIAFNPSLLGINIQGTNDTPAIFFGTLALYAAYRWFTDRRGVWFAVMLPAIIAGALTKASVLVIAGVLILALLAKVIFVKGAQQLKATTYLLVFLIGFGSTVPFLGGYYSNYKKYGSYTLSTWEKDPPPHFFEITPMGGRRPGLRSMYEGFFTFRLKNMVEQPYINNDVYGFPLHRCSLWSQLYGRMVFLHFDQWPPSWQSQTPVIINLGRTLIILGLVPLALFLLGLGRQLFNFARQLLRFNTVYLAQPAHYLALAVTLACLASSVYYTYNYRDFSSMKTIYILPGLIAFIYLLHKGIRLAAPAAGMLIKAAFCLIITLNILEECYLALQLLQ